MELQKKSDGQMRVSFGLAEKWISGFIGTVILVYFVWSASTLQTMTIKVAVMSDQMKSLDVVPQHTQKIANLELRTQMVEADIEKIEGQASALESRVNTLERVTPRN